MAIEFTHIDFELSPQEAVFVRWTLAASHAYRLEDFDSGQNFDTHAHERGESSEKAYACYHACYYAWRDSGFAAEIYGALIRAMNRIIWQLPA